MNQGQELIGHGRSLILGALIGLTLMIGTLFDILGSSKRRDRRPPIVPLHEWTIDLSDEDRA